MLLEEYCADLLAVVLRHCEVTKAVSTVRGGVMERFVFPAAALVVPLLTVALKVRDTFRAFLLIEYAFREDFTRRLNAGIDAGFRD